MSFELARLAYPEHVKVKVKADWTNKFDFMEITIWCSEIADYYNKYVIMYGESPCIYDEVRISSVPSFTSEMLMDELKLICMKMWKKWCMYHKEEIRKKIDQLNRELEQYD